MRKEDAHDIQEGEKQRDETKIEKKEKEEDERGAKGKAKEKTIMLGAEKKWEKGSTSDARNSGH